MAAMARLYKTLVFTAIAVCSMRLAAGEHPVPLEKNTDAAKCLECHDDKAKGKHVHSAIAMGCTACHEIKVEKDTTTVDLISPRQELCITCHEKSAQPTLHGPYAKGSCVLCHDPHASDFDKQLRSEGNRLCLECHQSRPWAGKFAPFNSSYEVTEPEFSEIPKIDLDPTQKFGHPVGRHKVADLPDPLHEGMKISCLTCHENHAGQAKLVRTTEYNGKKMDVCDACHMANDERSMAQAQKRADELEAQRQKEQQMRSKQPDVSPQRPRNRPGKP
jgi:predicted CXXCH cytochrome family protein